MIKKCFEVIIKAIGKPNGREYIFANDIEDAKAIAERHPFGPDIIDIIEADLEISTA